MVKINFCLLVFRQSEWEFILRPYFPYTLTLPCIETLTQTQVLWKKYRDLNQKHS